MHPDLLRKASAVLIVAAVEPSLDFWQRRLGLALIAQVPHGEGIGFALLQGGGIEVMLQSEASVRADAAPAMLAQFHGDKSYLYIEVGDLDAIARALDGAEVVMPRRTTFYGAEEIGYREPGGHFVTFARFAR